MFWFGVVAVGLALLRPGAAYFITVDAHAEECFFEKVEQGTKIGFMFQISEGGFLDIDYRIVGPDNSMVQKGERESSGKLTFSAHASGVYTFCFSNVMSTMTPKVVMFSIKVGESPASGDDKKESDSKGLETMIKELSQVLTGIKQEQEYMLVRDRIHRTINESTNSRVVLWSFFEACILVAMTFGQVYYLKRFFEVRRVV